MNQDDETQEGHQPEAEQAADLAALQAAAAGAVPAAAVAPGAPAGQAAPEQLPPPSAAAMASAVVMLKTFQPMVTALVPVLRNAPPEVWEPIPEGIAVLLDHFKANPAWLANPFVRAASALVPMAGFVALHMMQNPSPKKAKAAGEVIEAPPAPPPGAPAEPGARTVSFGTVEASTA